MSDSSESETKADTTIRSCTSFNTFTDQELDGFCHAIADSRKWNNTQFFRWTAWYKWIKILCQPGQTVHDAFKGYRKNCDTSKVKLLKKSILHSDTLPRLNLKMILSALLWAQSLNI